MDASSQSRIKEWISQSNLPENLPSCRAPKPHSQPCNSPPANQSDQPNHDVIAQVTESATSILNLTSTLFAAVLQSPMQLEHLACTSLRGNLGHEEEEAKPVCLEAAGRPVRGFARPEQRAELESRSGRSQRSSDAEKSAKSTGRGKSMIMNVYMTKDPAMARTGSSYAKSRACSSVPRAAF